MYAVLCMLERLTKTGCNRVVIPPIPEWTRPWHWRHDKHLKNEKKNDQTYGEWNIGKRGITARHGTIKLTGTQPGDCDR
jgi:hypothetical protein